MDFDRHSVLPECEHASEKSLHSTTPAPRTANSGIDVRMVGEVVAAALALVATVLAAPSIARELSPGQQRVEATIENDSRASFPVVASSPLKLRLPLVVGDVEFQLVPTEVFTEDATIRLIGKETTVLPRPQSIYFVGSSGDLPGSRAYFGLFDGGILGMVDTNEGRYFVEPYNFYNRNAAPRELVITEEAQMAIPPAPFQECGGTLAAHAANQPNIGAILAAAIHSFGAQPAYALPVPSGDVELVKLAMVADYPYYQLLGGSEQAVANWLGMLVLLEDATYLRDLGVTFRIANLDTIISSTESETAFPSGIGPYPYMSRCADYRTTHEHTAAGYGLTQCIRGSNYPGSTIQGVAASVGGVCGAGGSSFANGGIGLPGHSMTAVLRQASLMAHENGHVLGATHITSSSCHDLELGVPFKRCNGDGLACESNADCLASPPICLSNGRCPVTAIRCNVNADCGPGTCYPNHKDDGYVMWPELGYPFPGLPLGECALYQISDTLAGNSTYGNVPSSCLLVVQCGDVNRNTVVTASDALAALQQANCTSNCAYDGLADVAPAPPAGTPDGSVTQDDATLILQAAVGSLVLTTCGNFPAPYTP